MAIWFAAPIEHYPIHHPLAWTASATNQDASYPASNLATTDPTQVFRTTAGSTVITVTLPSVGYLDVISLLMTNTSYRATLVVETSSNAGGLYTSRYNGPLWANLVGAQPASVTGPGSATDERRGSLQRNASLLTLATDFAGADRVRLTVTDPLVTNITIGRLFLGRRWAPAYEMQYGSNLNFVDYGRRERTDNGVLVMDPSRVVSGASVKMDFLTKQEMYDYAFEFNKFLGSTREILACLDTLDIAKLQKNLLYCTIAEGMQISFDSFNNHSQNWVLESIA